MNPAIYDIQLDVNAMGSQTALAMRQHDNGRTLRITLRENGKPYEITNDCIAVFAATKPDGTHIFNDCRLEGNVAIYNVTSQTVAVSGMVEAELRIYDKLNHMLCSPRFDLIIDQAVFNDKAIESTNEFSTLNRLISEAIKLIDDTNAALDNGDFVPKFTIGAVESLPSNEEATVTLTGTGANPILNFGIPRGGNGSEVDHGLLLGRDLADQHPIGAITGLEDVLAAKQGILTPDSITETLIAANSVTARQLAADSVNTDILQDKAVTGSKLAPGAVNTAALGAKAVTGPKLADNSVGTSKIIDGAVTAAKIAAGAVGNFINFTIPYDGWVYDSNWGYKYVYENPSINNTSTVADVDVSGASSMAEGLALQKAYSKIYGIWIYDGRYEIYASKKPDISLPMATNQLNVFGGNLNVLSNLT